MEIQHRDDGKKGAFFVEQDGKQVAEMTYVWAGVERFIIDHTEVGQELKGQQAGKQLVAQAVKYAREKQVKIMPLCPFAHAVMMKNADYQDVISK